MKILGSRAPTPVRSHCTRPAGRHGGTLGHAASDDFPEACGFHAPCPTPACARAVPSNRHCVKFRRPFRMGRPRLASAVSVSWQVGLDFQAVGYVEAPSPTQDPSPPPPHSAATLVTDLKLAARWSPHNVTDGGPIHSPVPPFYSTTSDA